MINDICLALVKSAFGVRASLALKIAITTTESDEFFDALQDYHEYHFQFHKDLSEILQPLILDDDPRVSSAGCKLLEKYYNMFVDDHDVVSVKLAEAYCAKYKDYL